MKVLVLVFSFLIVFQVNAATAPTVDTSSEEITLDDLHEEFMKEADTLVVEDEDENFLDEEIEGKLKIQSQLKSTTPETKSSAKAPTATSTQKK
jgi:hypothetical protein